MEIKLSQKEGPDSPLEFILSFTDYLSNSAHMHDKKWNLSNSILSQGKVYLNKKDVVRLLEEDIRRRIEKRLDVKFANYPTELTLIGRRLRNSLQK